MKQKRRRRRRSRKKKRRKKKKAEREEREEEEDRDICHVSQYLFCSFVLHKRKQVRNNMWECYDKMSILGLTILLKKTNPKCKVIAVIWSGLDLNVTHTHTQRLVQFFQTLRMCFSQHVDTIKLCSTITRTQTMRDRIFLSTCVRVLIFNCVPLWASFKQILSAMENNIIVLLSVWGEIATAQHVLPSLCLV